MNGRVLSLSSGAFLSVYISVGTVDIFVLTKLHEFVICKGSEEIVRKYNWCRNDLTIFS